MVGLGREPRAKNRHKANVFGMYVAPEFRRRGIARALLRHLIAAARQERDLEQLVLTVTHSNESARALYESEGFRSFGIEPRALRVADRYYDKNHMVLFSRAPERTPGKATALEFRMAAPAARQFPTSDRLAP